MSRPIKFRAWHEGRKEWLHDSSAPCGGCSILGETIWAFGEWCRVPIEELNDVVVEQWTGLHDRDGQFIYEGDIVAIRSAHGEVNLEDCRLEHHGDLKVYVVDPAKVPPAPDSIYARAKIEWSDDMAGWQCQYLWRHDGQNVGGSTHLGGQAYVFDVLGNVHQHSHLLSP